MALEEAESRAEACESQLAAAIQVGGPCWLEQMPCSLLMRCVSLMKCLVSVQCLKKQ